MDHDLLQDILLTLVAVTATNDNFTAAVISAMQLAALTFSQMYRHQQFYDAIHINLL